MDFVLHTVVLEIAFGLQVLPLFSHALCVHPTPTDVSSVDTESQSPWEFC